MSASGVGPTGGPGDVLASLRDGRIQGKEERLRAATQLLEGVFYQQLFKAMRDTVPEGGAMSKGEGEEMFEGLLDERMAEAAAMRQEGGLGEALFLYFRQHVLVQGDAPADTLSIGPEAARIAEPSADPPGTPEAADAADPAAADSTGRA